MGAGRADTVRAPGPGEPLGLGLLEEAWAWPRSWQPRGGQDRGWGVGRSTVFKQPVPSAPAAGRPHSRRCQQPQGGAGGPARGNNPILVPRGPAPEEPPLPAPAPSPTDSASTDCQDRPHPGRGARRHQGHQWPDHPQQVGPQFHESLAFPAGCSAWRLSGGRLALPKPDWVPH